MGNDDGDAGAGDLTALPRRTGVRVYLFALFALVACVPVVLLGFFQGRRLAAEAREDTDRQTLATATAFSLQVSLALTDYLRATESLAAQIRAHGGLAGNVSAALEAHSAPHPEFVGSYAARANGISFAHYSRGIGPFAASQDYTSRDYYQELRRTGLPSISRVQVGRVTGSPDIQIVAPILDDSGEMIGFVCTSVDLQRLSERAAVFARGLTEGRLLVLDKERRVIADSTRRQATLTDVSPVALYASTSEPVTRSGADETNTLTAAATVPVSEPSRGWNVVASVPMRIVEDRTTGAQAVVLLVALGAMGFALALAAFLTVRLSAPLRALARSAIQIASGDAHQLPIVPRRAPRELAQVTEAVRRMVVALREYAGGLQVLVDERTRELKSANLELASTLGRLEREQTVLAQDLARARYFQERLLPTIQAPFGLDVATHFRPLEQVGGDIYDVVQLSAQRYRVFLADATGHGVQAAMRTIVIKFEYDRLKREIVDLNELLAALNRRLIELFPEGELHCAAVCADLAVAAHGIELFLASAGGAQVLVGNAEALQELYVPGPLLGVSNVSFDPPTRALVPRGSSIVFATDGLFEQMNHARRRFDAELGPSLFRDASSASERLQALVQHFDAFLAGSRPLDDVTALVVQISDSPPVG
jgi:serine phosphatase RsbU (regulator of sigma subunit)